MEAKKDKERKQKTPSYLRPHVAHRLVVCESQRLRSHEHRDAKHHQKYNFIQINFINWILSNCPFMFNDRIDFCKSPKSRIGMLTIKNYTLWNFPANHQTRL